MKWCRGIHSLGIIANCVDKLLSIYEYDHIYQMIEHCLKLVNPEFVQSGVQALLSVL